MRHILVLLFFPFNSTQPSFVNLPSGSFWFPLIMLRQIWRCCKFAPMRTEISLPSIGTSLRCDHFCCIFAFDMRCAGRLTISTTHVFFTSIWWGWCVDQIENSTKFDVTETDVDIALVLFNFLYFPFNFSVFANSDVVNVVSEPEPIREFTIVVFAPCITVTGIFCKNKWNLSGFVKFDLLV